MSTPHKQNTQIRRGRRPRRPADKKGVKSDLRAVGDASPYKI